MNNRLALAKYIQRMTRGAGKARESGLAKGNTLAPYDRFDIAYAKGSIPPQLVKLPPPLPQEVCPSKDSPLSWYHMLGWMLMSKRVWPHAAPHNPIIYYLTGKRWSSRIEDLIGIVPWLMLLGAEGVVMWFAIESVNLWIFFQFLLLELLLLPLLAGLWTQVMVFFHYTRIKTKVPMEELSLTRLQASEIMTALSLRPITVQMAATQLFTIAAVIVLLVLHELVFAYNTLYGNFEFILILGGLGYRAFILRTCTEFPGIIAMRSCLFIPHTPKAMIRAARDWFFPWGLFPFFLVMGVAGSILILKVTFIFFYLAFLGPLFALFLLFQIPHLMRTYAGENVFWIQKSFGRWCIRTGTESPSVPKSLLAKWELEESLRKVRRVDPKGRPVR